MQWLSSKGQTMVDISPHRILGCVVGCAGIDSSSLSTSGAVHRSYLCISRFSQFLQQWIIFHQTYFQNACYVVYNRVS